MLRLLHLGGIDPTVLTPAVFTSSAIRDILVDSIPAGEFVDVSVDVAHLCRTTNTCRAYDYDAYRRANITYEDRCNNNYTLGNSNLGGVGRIRGLGVIESNAPAIADGQTRTFSTTFSDLQGLNTNSEAIWEIILPDCGVSFASNTGDITWGSTSPTNITTSGDTIRAVFGLTTSNAYDNEPFSIILTGACGACNINQSIEKRLLTNTCVSNPNHCQMCIYNTTESLTIQNCTLGGGCTGAGVSGFTFLRTSLGLPDNDNNRIPDATGSLDLNAIDRSRFLFGDTAQATLEAVIRVNAGTPVFSFAYGELTIDDH